METIINRLSGNASLQRVTETKSVSNSFMAQSRNSFQCRLGDDVGKPRYMIDLKYIDKMRALLPFMDVIPSAYNRLIGTFEFESDDKATLEFLNNLYKTIQVNDLSLSWPVFQRQIVDSCIAKGFGIGEGIRLGRDVAWDRLKNFDANTIGVKKDSEGRYHLGTYDRMGKIDLFENTDLIYYYATDLRDGQPLGYSIYHGMPWMVSILEHLYQAISNISWRTADPSFIISIVGGKPEGQFDVNQMMSATNTAAAAMRDQIAEIMTTKLYGGTRDAMAGLPHGAQLNIDILGAGGEGMIEALKIPIEEMIKPCIGKSALPDWYFGYNYGRTESLSNNQLIVLTENVEIYRTELMPIAMRFFGEGLAMEGLIGKKWNIKWKPIGIKNKLEEARTELFKAQSDKIRWETAFSKFETGTINFDQLEQELGVKFTEKERQDISVKMLMNKVAK